MWNTTGMSRVVSDTEAARTPAGMAIASSKQQATWIGPPTSRAIIGAGS